MIQKINRVAHAVFYKPLLKLYLRTEPTVSFDGFRLKVLRGVFHPTLYFSTTYLYSFLAVLNLRGKKFLEVGCGAGLLSMLALRKGAEVVSVDLNPAAVQNTRMNIANNFPAGVKAIIQQSDLFKSIPAGQFDLIVVNPPYYFKNAGSDAGLAWYCGANGEYFEEFFRVVGSFIHPETLIYMVLEENCEIYRIQAIAARHNATMKLVDQKKFKWETSFIFQVIPGSVNSATP